MRKLPNAPLQEAIFEMRWPLQPDDSGRQLVDADYPLALGKFQEALKNDFPHHISKFPQDIPAQLLTYQTVHQFWQQNKKWPVIQLGPGIATLNDTDENYEWENTYLPNIQRVLDALTRGYGKLTFSMLSLRYVDVVLASDYKTDRWESFLHNSLNFTFENQFDTRGKLKNFNFMQAFDLEEQGLLNVSFRNAQNDKQEDIFVWQIAVEKNTNTDQKDVLNWLNEAHKHTSDLFKEICKDEFYASFKS